MSEILAAAVQAFWASRILDIRLLSFIPRSRSPNDKLESPYLQDGLKPHPKQVQRQTSVQHPSALLAKTRGLTSHVGVGSAAAKCTH